MYIKPLKNFFKKPIDIHCNMCYYILVPKKSTQKQNKRFSKKF